MRWWQVAQQVLTLPCVPMADGRIVIVSASTFSEIRASCASYPDEIAEDLEDAERPTSATNLARFKLSGSIHDKKLPFMGALYPFVASIEQWMESQSCLIQLSNVSFHVCRDEVDAWTMHACGDRATDVYNLLDMNGGACLRALSFLLVLIEPEPPFTDGDYKPTGVLVLRMAGHALAGHLLYMSGDANLCAQPFFDNRLATCTHLDDDLFEYMQGCGLLRLEQLPREESVYVPGALVSQLIKSDIGKSMRRHNVRVTYPQVDATAALFACP
jgi:hypothetical protein